MTGPTLARRIANVIARGLPESAVTVHDRDATVRAMRLALRRRRARRMQLRWLGAIAVAAAVLLAIGTMSHRHRDAAVATAPQPPMEAVAEQVSGGVLVLSGGRTSPLVDHRPIAMGDHVLALFDGHATIAFPTGTRLTVSGGGDVALLTTGETQIFALSAGSVRADVAKLHAGERFVIRTADAEVEVRGTSFEVAVTAPDPACGHGTTTRVGVFEGVVTVRAQGQESAVRAGEAWPQDCKVTSADTGPVSPLAPSVAPPAGVPPRSWAAPKSELAAQNDLFNEAMTAKRRGEVRSAIASFDRLLSRYPDCPLAESAAAERMKLLAEVDRARGAEAARDYLRRHPAGFAREDAESLLR
jgi:hypothetical protein